MNKDVRTITQKGRLDFTSDNMSPMEIVRRLESVGIYVTGISIFSPIWDRDGEEIKF